MATTISPSHPAPVVAIRPARAWYSSVALWSTVAATASLSVLLAHGGGRWAGVRVPVLVVAVLAAVVGASGAPRARRALEAGLGVVALVTGAGFIPFVIEEPASIVALAAVIAVVAGPVLMVTGMAGLRRVAHRSIRLAIAVVSGALVLGVGYVAVPAIMVTSAPRAVLDRVPADVGLSAVDVALPTRDGVTLAGWYVASRNGAGIVLLHGSGSSRSDVLDHAAALAAEGFGVLMVDARGHGASTGDPMERGWHGDADIAAATAYLTARPDVDPVRIGVVGISMGGEEAIGATATNDVLRAVVAEGATGRSSADLSWLPHRYGWRGALQHRIVQWRDALTTVLAVASRPVPLATAIKDAPDVRFLLITAGEVADETFAADDLTAVAPTRVTTWDVPGSSHAAALDTEPDGWRHHVVTFLRHTLLDDTDAP